MNSRIDKHNMQLHYSIEYLRLIIFGQGVINGEFGGIKCVILLRRCHGISFIVGSNDSRDQNHGVTNHLLFNNN